MNTPPIYTFPTEGKMQENDEIFLPQARSWTRLPGDHDIEMKAWPVRRPVQPNLRNERLTRSVTLLLEFCRPQMEAALASDNVAEEEKAMLRGQLKYFETALTTP